MLEIENINKRLTQLGNPELKIGCKYLLIILLLIEIMWFEWFYNCSRIHNSIYLFIYLFIFSYKPKTSFTYFYLMMKVFDRF